MKRFLRIDYHGCQPILGPSTVEMMIADEDDALKIARLICSVTSRVQCSYRTEDMRQIFTWNGEG